LVCNDEKAIPEAAKKEGIILHNIVKLEIGLHNYDAAHIKHSTYIWSMLKLQCKDHWRQICIQSVRPSQSSTTLLVQVAQEISICLFLMIPLFRYVSAKPNVSV
jgi:hypothetical protein